MRSYQVLSADAQVTSGHPRERTLRYPDLLRPSVAGVDPTLVFRLTCVDRIYLWPGLEMENRLIKPKKSLWPKNLGVGSAKRFGAGRDCRGADSAAGRERREPQIRAAHRQAAAPQKV